MKIIITQDEIEEAIRSHIATRLRVADGMKMSIELNATRGPEGFRATIDIAPVDDASSVIASTISSSTPTAPPVSMPPVAAPVVPTAAAAPVPAAVSAPAPVAAPVTLPTPPILRPRTPAQVREMLAKEAEEVEEASAGTSAGTDVAPLDRAPAASTAAPEEAGGGSSEESGEGSDTEAPKPRAPRRSLWDGLKRPSNAAAIPADNHIS